jgi:predicted Zn-ribbon and HTH transcriptional regulator
MWFFKTENGTFCIRYLREGYGLFIDEDYLTWQKDAEAVAKLVFDQRTGYSPWDSMITADRPKDLGEWQTLADIQTIGPINPSLDPVIVPLDCDCGHQIRESIARIRTICKFRCPECKSEIRVGADQMQAIMEKAKENYPNGYIKSLSRQ